MVFNSAKMAIGVDSSKWKPRKITGTPAAKFRNRLAAGILGFGILCGAFFQYSSYTEPMKKATEVLYEDPIEEVERKIIIASGLHLRSGNTIRRMMVEEERVDLPHNKYKVVSKYFSCKTVMDESLSDFKEKKNIKVTKNIKAPPAKPKVKKVKTVKGQKDIRTVLKAKKNELLAYSEDFDSICKKSGIDVDSEQLQLAIALSKSLQTTSAESSALCSKSLTSKQRTGLIRTTLKEYGFKVPEKPSTFRRTKKRREPYKLMLTSEEEKQQIITDRYSQVLFELNNLKTTLGDKNLELSNLFIYNMSTNIEYEKVKDDDVFYVDNIIEKSPNNMGCLLKIWSDIPGRPSSPDKEKSDLFFSEIECSQDELDTMLSGPFKYSRDLLYKKSIDYSSVKRNIKTPIKSSPELVEDFHDNHSSPDFLLSHSDNRIDHEETTEKFEEPSKAVIDKRKDNILVVTQLNRSLSPDLFDVEDDAVVEIPNDTAVDSETKLTNNATTTQASILMDLTECVNVVSQKTINISKCMTSVSQTLHQIDVTRRKSNDYMEITECVGRSSQIVLESIDEDIDLTGHCKSYIATEKNNMSVPNVQTVTCDDSPPALKKVEEHIDLTENCKSYIEEKNISGNAKEAIDNILELEHVTNEHIDLTGHCVSDINIREDNQNIEYMDLTQSSNLSTDSLPSVQIGGTQTVAEKSGDDTIILNEADYLETRSPVSNDKINEFSSYQQSKGANIGSKCANTEDFIETTCSKQFSVQTDSAPVIDLDETNEFNNEGEITESNTEDSNLITCSKKLDLITESAAIVNLDAMSEVFKVNDDNVDLTQSSDSNEAPDNVSIPLSHQVNNSSLGKNDDVSVDYDEALENMNAYCIENYNNDTVPIEDYTENSDENEMLSNSNKDILEVNDNKSNSQALEVENHFDFGGISVIDNLPSFNSKSRNTIDHIPNESTRDSLPIVNLKSNASEKTKLLLTNQETNVDPTNHRPENKHLNNAKFQTPPAKNDRKIVIETPKQSEYIIKTENVTPMLDYASMSTPETNRELDKYGLKPFKRKRAIQVLTHLYNQTHPFVESTEELSSVSKKRKTTSLIQPSSSTTSSTELTLPMSALGSPKKSPRTASKSPRKITADFENISELDNEDELFSVTSEVPIIRNIECDAEDWVFQKQKKSKLHSCRVPLHIVFHNYMSCRRRLHEAILRYEPVNIQVVHKELAVAGYRYDRKELLKFLDKKCITVKTPDDAENKRHK